VAAAALPPPAIMDEENIVANFKLLVIGDSSTGKSRCVFGGPVSAKFRGWVAF